MRPRSLSGSPSFATTGCGFTPAVQTSERVGMTSPSESVAAVSVSDSSVVSMRNSIPRARSSRIANSARPSEISGMTRPVASTRTKRIPDTRQRG